MSEIKKFEVKSEVFETSSAVESSDHDSNAPEQIDPATEKKLLAKLDLWFTPVFMLAYLSGYLDRTNIGNVKIAGMPQAIGANTQQISLAISLFFVTAFLFEMPAAILLKILTPRVVLTTVTFVWSLTTIFTGLITFPAGLYISRLVLGACEAGLLPCLTVYLTMVYKREEQARRTSYLFSCTALAGAFGGLLAYALLHMDGVAGLEGWRWVYIIEGVFSILVAIVLWFGLPTNPAEAWFLKPEERAVMRRRQDLAKAYMDDEKFNWQEVRNAMRDPKVYFSALIMFFQNILLSGFSIFLPSILKAAGYTTLQSNYLTIPVYVFGGSVFIIVAYASDKMLLRAPFLLATNTFGIIAYIILLTNPRSNGVKYFATYLCSIAVFTGCGLNLVWLNVNTAPHYRRATAMGFNLSIGIAAGACIAFLYQKPPFKVGHGFSLASLAASQILIITKMLYIRYVNNQKARIARGEIEDTRKVKTGDRAIDYKYHY